MDTKENMQSLKPETKKKNNNKIIKKLTHPHPQNNPKQTIFKKLILKKRQLVQAFEHVPRDSVK